MYNKKNPLITVYVKGVIIYNNIIGHRQTNTEATSQSDNPENHR